jgi:septal ring factor EnvC (AmiA/AmiB activator)
MTRFALAATLAVSTVLVAQQPDLPSVAQNPAATASSDRAEALTRRAADRLHSLQQEADRLASEENTLLGDLRKLEIAREIKVEELRQASAAAGDAARELARVNDAVSRLEREDVSERPQLRARIIELYKLGQGRYLRLLLSTSNVRDVGQASRMVAAVAKLDRERVQAHERTLTDLRASRAALEGKTRGLAAARGDAERARAQAEQAVAARNRLIADIDRQRDLNAQLAGELVSAQQKLQSTLRALSPAPADTASLPLRPFRGDLDWPVQGAVRQPFGRPAPGKPGTSGIEIAADDGTDVHAVHDGTVAFAGPFAGFANLVIVQHEADAFSLYGNLSDTAVQRGAHVERGQTLGSVGASTTGPPGLYFEIRVGGQAVDPLQWLKRAH